MKALALIMATSLAASTVALAQQSTVRGNASAESQAAVAAGRRGASVDSDSRAQGSIAAERGQNGGAAADLAGASEMNATLERSVDARRAKPGDEVTAKTNEELVTQSGVTIPRGTKLVGRVTEARARGEGAASSQLGIVFDKAVLEDGRELAMNATIEAVAAARSDTRNRVGSASHDGGTLGASHAAGSGVGRLGGGLGGGAIDAGGGLAGGVAGRAGGTIGGVTRLPGAGAAGAAAHGGAVLGSSAGAVGGLSSSGRLLAGSRGVFGLRDVSIASAASAAAASARGTLLTSASRNVRLDGGTQLLLVGSLSR
jgi:hypothetical protein